MDNTKQKVIEHRKKRALRVSKRVKERSVGKNRVIVSRSNMHLTASLVEPTGRMSFTITSKSKAHKAKAQTKKDKAVFIGQLLGDKIVELKLQDRVVFDRKKNAFHGHVKTILEEARKKGVNC